MTYSPICMVMKRLLLLSSRLIRSRKRSASLCVCLPPYARNVARMWDNPSLPLTGLPKRWERVLKRERMATVSYVFNSELVDFEGTFGGVTVQLLLRSACSNGGVSLLA